MKSLVLIAAVVVVLWLVANAAGIRMSLLPSLIISVGLTLLLNLVMGAFRGRGRRTGI